MKKVILASLLACAAIAAGLSSASAQTDTSAAGGAIQMSADEYQVYNNAWTMPATDAKTAAAKAAALDAYLVKYPQSAVQETVLETIMGLYSATGDSVKTLDAADRLLKVNPNSIRGLLAEAIYRKGAAGALTDPAAQLAALDAAASYAQKGLTAPKPTGMSDADFKTLQATAVPIFYSVIGADDLAKKDYAGAIAAFKSELAAVPLAQTQNPQQQQLPDTYQLAIAYWQSTPADFLDCAFYASRFVAYAPDPFKSQVAPTAKYCYKKYHGADDGYDAILTLATNNLFAPSDIASTIKPAPTPADIVNGVFASTPDLTTLATCDKVYVLQYGTPDQAGKVWDTIKSKSYQFPDVLVIASTPAQVQVAICDDAIQAKASDFTFNMKAPDPLPDLPANATPAAKLAYKKKQAAADKLAADIATATAVGQKVTLSGTYDSYTPKPIMITMSDGALILPEAKPAPKAAPVHHTPAKK